MKERVHPDLRRHSRFEVLECAMIFRDKESQSSAALIVDISLGGLQTRSHENYAVDEICVIVVGRDGEAPLSIPAKVVYTLEIAESGLTATGFRFLPASMEERMAIVQHVHEIFQRQGERLME